MAMHKIRRVGLAVVVLACLLTGAARAAVEDYVPGDAAVVVTVRGVEEHFDRFRNSALMERLEDPGSLPELAEKIREGRAGLAEFERAQNVDVRQLLMDMAGGDVALVGFTDETGVAVSEVANARSLNDAVTRFLSVEQQTGGSFGQRTVEYQGTEIQVCDTPKGERYHAVSGRVLAVGSDLIALQKVLDTISGRMEPISGAGKFRDAMKLVPTDAALSVYLDVPRFAPDRDELEAGLRGMDAGDPGKRVAIGMLRTVMAEVVDHIRFAVGSVRSEDGLLAHGVVAFDEGRLPALIGDWMPSPGSRIDILDAAPEGTIFAVARNINAAAARSTVMRALEQGDPSAAAAMRQGMDALVNMTPGVYSAEQFFEEIGGQSMLLAVPSAEGDAPPGGAIVLRLGNTQHIPVLLESLAGMLVMGARQGGTPLTMSNEEYRGARLLTIGSESEANWTRFVSPTFGVAGSDLIVASTLESARQLVDGALSGAAMRPATVDGTPHARAYMDVNAVRALLQQHKELLVQHAVREEGKSPERARQDLETLASVLSLFRNVELAASYEGALLHNYAAIRMDLSSPSRR